MKYTELPSKPNIPEIQDDVLKFWRENNVFEKSVSDKKGEEVVFYDGPPFPTGIPHHGTVLSSFIKDMIARYQTMKGHPVPRVWGWDCHGLPIENQAEKKLGIENKKEIEKDISGFNDTCFDIVSGSNEAWREYVEQMARWVDYDGAYKTMSISFMESVMWAFKQCYDKGLIYRDYRVTPYCMQCETSLSISDTRESDSTRPRQDRWVIAKFKLDSDLSVIATYALQSPRKPVYILAWTTTPWTLPSNMCLAVSETVDYAFVDVGEEIYIASKATLSQYEKIFGKVPAIIHECTGKDMLGLTYEPLFPYFAKYKEDGAFKVVSADYIDAGDGTGVVHTAPAFGEDDYWTCKKNNMPFVNPVDSRGRFTAEVSDFYSPSGDKNVIETNSDIIRWLHENNKAALDGTLEHNYPHCWRCREPLIYRAMDAWYFSIEKVKDDLIKANEEINWVPETVKHGRFGNWLEGARDWNISRNRYWSTPIPIWECDKCGERVVLGSIDEIFEASGIRLDNLHRQFMDKVTFPCKCGETSASGGGTMRRIPEVLDCWFESGSVTFAQKHYPFENRDWFDTHFPSDFIVEYTGQIRCWFYYMHVLAVALFNRPSFKNCIVHGTILADDGKKLSKSSKNYTDPMELMKQYGTDAYRLYMYQSNAMLMGDLNFNTDGIPEMFQQIILPFWNACNFYISYANIDGYYSNEAMEPKSDNQLDKWILAELYSKAKAIEEAMDDYQIDKYIEPVTELISSLTNWYIRRSRRRFWGSEMTADKKSAYGTLFYVLVNTTKILAPVAPIMSEHLYKTLTGKLSVHLDDWPSVPETYRDETLTKQVDIVREVINLARSVRSKNRIKNRQPLSVMKVAFTNAKWNELIDGFGGTIAEEMNVKSVEVLENVEDIAALRFDPNFNEIRNRYPDRLPEIIKAVKSGKFELREREAVLTLDGGEESFDPEIILVSYKAGDDSNIAGNMDMVVSLDLTISDELRREGLARDMIRNIQETRKQIGCDIMDRIKISIDGEYPTEWADHIMTETLSSIETSVEPTSTVEVADDTGGVIKIAIER